MPEPGTGQLLITPASSANLTNVVPEYRPHIADKSLSNYDTLINKPQPLVPSRTQAFRIDSHSHLPIEALQ